MNERNVSFSIDIDKQIATEKSDAVNRAPGRVFGQRFVSSGVLRQDFRRHLDLLLFRASAHQVGALFAFRANVLDKLRVWRHANVHFHRPRRGIGHGIVQCHRQIHAAKCRPMKTFRYVQGFRVRMAAHVQPGSVIETRVFHH
jgi:hypothetical protein